MSYSYSGVRQAGAVGAVRGTAGMQAGFGTQRIQQAGIVQGRATMQPTIQQAGGVQGRPTTTMASNYAATPSYAGLTSRSAAPVTTAVQSRPQFTQAAPMTQSYPQSTIMSSPTRANLPTTIAAPAAFGTTRMTAQPMQSMQYAAPIRQAPIQSYGGNFIGGQQATYIGGNVITTQSANLLAQGNLVSERVVSMEEAYGSGLVRSEVAPSYYNQTNQPVYTEVVQPQYTEVMQPVYQEVAVPVTEAFVGPGGQIEYVQGVEIVEQVDQAGMDRGMEVLQQQEQQQQVVEQQAGEQQPGPPRVVIICTSTNMMGDHPTGAWSEEITGAYYVFLEAGCEIYIASILGGAVPIDQASLAEGNYKEHDRRFQEEGGLQFLENTIAISDVRAEDIDCVWLAGGHGTCMDFEAGLAQFVTDAVAYGRPVGAVCHGVIGLLSAINQDGTPLLAGRQVTGFSNAEEDMVGLSGKVPYLCQTRMEELGALYSCAEPWSDYAIADGALITGQNPQSSVRAASLCIQAMMPQPQ